MMRRAAAVLTLGLAALAQPAVAGEGYTKQMLESVAAEPLAGAPAVLSYVDFDALYAWSGFAGGDWRALPPGEREAQEALLWDALLRINTHLPFLQYLRAAEQGWTPWLGVDYAALDWAATLGPVPQDLLYLGFDAPPLPAIEAALAARGLERSEAEGIVFYGRGEDGRISPVDREPGYPFWGALGASERLALLPHALVGSRFEAVTRAAALGPRLTADAAVSAAFAAATGEGALLQATLLREDFSPWYIKALLPAGTSIEQAQAELETQAPGPLPAFELVLLGDRQGTAGEETVIALVYATRADAETAAATLPARLAAYRLKQPQRTLLEQVGATASASVVEQEGRYVALVVLRPGADPDPKRPPAYAYRVLIMSYLQQDAGWLTWK